MGDAFTQERLRDPMTTGVRTHMHEMHVHRAVVRGVDLGDPNRLAVVFGEEHSARVELPKRVRPLLVPALGDEAGRLRHLALELLPQLPQGRFVRGSGAPDVQGVLTPVSR